MRAWGCARESDVLDLIAIGQWPSRADESLRRHVASCASCADLAAVASAVIEASDAEIARARVPDASVVWYRARQRAREEKMRRAARPLLITQTAAAVAIFALGALAWSTGASWLAGWSGELRTLLGGWPVRAASIALGGWAVLIAAAISLAGLADAWTDRPDPHDAASR